MPATISRLGRKKKSAEEAQPQIQTAVVRIDADLARMASIIATATGRDVAEVLSPLLRAQLEREYAKTVTTLGQEIGKKQEGE